MAIIIFELFKSPAGKKGRAYFVEQPSFYFEKDSKGKTIRKRQIQYCPNLESIFVDEQIKVDPKPVFETIRIDRGKITIDDELHPAKAEFLKKHRKLGVDWKILDVEADDRFEIKQFEATDRAKKFIFDANSHTIRAMAIELISPHLAQIHTIDKLRLSLRGLADTSFGYVEKINGFVDDHYHQEKLLVSALLTEKIIALVDKTFTWADSDEKIFTASQTHDAPRDLAIWLKNDEAGRQVQSIFAKKIKSKSKKQNA